AEDALLIEAAPLTRMGVRGDGHAGSAMGLRNGPQHALDAGSQAGLICRALENSGLYSGSSDADLDILHEHVCHQLGSSQDCAGSLEMKEERDVVVGVEAGGHDDI